MPGHSPKFLSFEDLRLRAESLLAGEERPRRDGGDGDLPSVVHELGVLQIELEMQNDELRRQQFQLEQARDRYRDLYDHAPVGFVTLDASARIWEANARAAELLQTEGSELVGRTLAAFMNQEDADMLHLHLHAVLHGRSPQLCDVTLRTRSGALLPVRIKSVAAAGDKRTECRSVIADVSDLRRAEDDRRIAEAVSNSLLDTLAGAVVRADVHGRIESFNRHAEQMFGYRAEDVIGQNVRVLMPAPYREEHDGYIHRHVATGESRIIGHANREALGLRKDGTTFPIEFGIGRWWDHDGLKFAAIIHDISARKHTEQELRESEGRFRAMADSAPMLLWTSDTEGKCDFVNQGWLEYTGRSLDEELAEGWLAGVHPDDRERCVSTFHNALAAREPFRMEYRLRRADQQYRWVFDAGVPRWTPDQSFVGYIGAAADVHDAKQISDELRHVQKMEAVGALASGVAHDFNNVLQAILGCINAARNEGRSPESAREYLDRAAYAARRGGELANRLMMFTRKGETDPKPMHLDRVIARTVSLLERMLTEQITLEVATEAADACIVADPVQIEQILMNLAVNARDAMPAGGRLSIRTELMVLDPEAAGRIGLESGRDYVRLTVEDSGEGMDERTRSRIFEPFFTTKEMGKGTGLGLSTVFALTHQLRGHVEVESEKGEGTSFVFLFPCAPTESVPPVSEKQPSQVLTGTALVIEDDALVRETTCHYLEALGLEVIATRGAEETLALIDARGGSLDLVVSDVVLPVMRGPELAELVRERYPDVAVLYITGSPTLLDDDELSGERVSVLHKPFDKENLAEALALLMG